MPNLTALLGLVIGLAVLFVSPEIGVKLIGVYLLVAGVLTLISSPNAEAVPPAPRRARFSKAPVPAAEDEDEPDKISPTDPADAYRTFTPEEISASRRPRRSSAASGGKRRSASRPQPDALEDEE